MLSLIFLGIIVGIIIALAWCQRRRLFKTGPRKWRFEECATSRLARRTSYLGGEKSTCYILINLRGPRTKIWNVEYRLPAAALESTRVLP
jgi:hypothetical protein